MSAATFEQFRIFAAEAVEQLLVEMAEQQTAYNVPAGEVLTLLDKVAKATGSTPWDVWETWAMRHAIPVHEAIAEGVSPDARRLRDLLGYAVLGLALAERG